jgi:hypothetical protein
MRYRDYFFLALLVAAPACTADVEGPTGVRSGDALFEEGIKPPPPLGSEDVDISISSPSSETPSEILTLGGPSAASVGNLPFNADVHGLYFSNSELTNGWILFLSEECLIASPDAKLQFNEKNGRTFGHGTLTKTCGDVDVVLDLSKIQITGGGFGGCEVSLDDVFTCRQILFTYDGIEGGVISVGPPIIIT